MKKLVAINLLFFIFFFLITPIHASITVEGSIDQNIDVVYAIENINSTLYEKILEQKIFNVSTIPEAIKTYLERRGLENVELDYDPTKEIFNNFTKSIQIEFSLSGSDIIDVTIDRAALTKTYNVKTEWRKIQVNLTDDFSLDFAEYFQEPVSDERAWQITNYTINGDVHPTYLYNSTETTFDSLCRFVLPTEASNIRTTKDTIIFDLRFPLEDNLINSPFLVLWVLIIVNIALIAYRRIRR